MRPGGWGGGSSVSVHRAPPGEVPWRGTVRAPAQSCEAASPVSGRLSVHPLLLTLAPTSALSCSSLLGVFVPISPEGHPPAASPAGGAAPGGGQGRESGTSSSADLHAIPCFSLSSPHPRRCRVFRACSVFLFLSWFSPLQAVSR